MSSGTLYPHLSIDDDGTVRIGTTRYTVLHLAAEHFHHGWSAEDLLHQHPDLRPEQIYSALTCFYDNFDDMIAAMRNSSDVQQPVSSNPFTRQELLDRRAKKGT